MDLLEAARMILEMSYNRRRAMELIPSHATQLARKMVMVHHMPSDCLHAPHWEHTLNTHISEIAALTEIKGNKRLKKADVNQTVYDEPFGEYRNYVRHHDIISKDKSEIKFSPPNQVDYGIIKSKYSKLVNILSNEDRIPEYKDLG